MWPRSGLGFHGALNLFADLLCPAALRPHVKRHILHVDCGGWITTRSCIYPALWLVAEKAEDRDIKKVGGGLSVLLML
ncbi:hypothetical protein PILCRDRAFT_811980 [Piloderma croceum F 1598]|uniref:Uncharacterized protein n=1 Tax=Piloderma croceum (strain F 1598) TaxID=765440 RepID=A0A0C3GHZ5_PILCF|nr:hypothetical protein PILCRDRAFT_811980 [Piloderma croceum F 1598]